ncbi:MAG: PCRF domain-containing protein, partial [Bacilli bacterium]|nr:PCRF domain-containing protein [Bacilli bacterium]
MEEAMRKRLNATKVRYYEIETELAKDDIGEDLPRLTALTKEKASLEAATKKFEEYLALEKEVQDTFEMENMGDPELIEFAKETRKEDEAKMEALEGVLQTILLPKDPNDDKNIIVEIRGAVGGEEANLFAGDLVRMYSHYAEKQGWKIKLLDASVSDAGGYSNVSFMIQGESVYSKLKFESGAHRVQRVPKTEASGRIHTSTATVLVMPEAEEVDVKINPNDLKIDTYHSQGAGGQNVNKTESAVRITHLPTGLVVACQTEKAQLQNKEIAMQMIRSKVFS